MKTAIIFGVTGQDGSYLSELLLLKGYNVVGVARRVSVPTDSRIKHLHDNPRFKLLEGDVTDAFSVFSIIQKYNPVGNGRLEVYNLAAQSHVKTSFDQPILTTNATYLGCLNCLEAIRQLPNRSFIRFYQASSSEMFGNSFSRVYKVSEGGESGDEYVRIECGPDSPYVFGQADSIEYWLKSGDRIFQDEDTAYLPCSPYAVAKLAAHHLCKVYRESYGLFACSGILFNHESERRGELFVTRKITKWMSQFIKDIQELPDHRVEKLVLGNLDAKRDWGHAEDYVRAMWLMLQQEKADDFVIATGETHSVRDFLSEAFKVAGEKVGVLNTDPELCIKKFVTTDPSLFRPSEVPYLKGDPTKANQILGWKPTIQFHELVRRMVEHDIKKV